MVQNSIYKYYILAAVNSESEVEAAITVLMEDKIIPTTNKIKDLLYIKSQEKVEVHVDQPMVNQHDSLLELIA